MSLQLPVLSGLDRRCTGREQRRHIFFGLSMFADELEHAAALCIQRIHVVAGSPEHLEEADKVMRTQTPIGPGQDVMVNRLVTLRTKPEEHGNLLIGHGLANHLLLVFTHGQPLQVNR